MEKTTQGTINYSADLKWKKIKGTEYAAYRYTVRFHSLYKIPFVEQEGVALIEELNSANLNNFKIKNDLCFVSNFTLELYCCRGWIYENEISPDDKKLLEYSYKPYTHFVFLDTIVRFDNASHMIFDVHDNALPVGIHYEYIQGSINDKYYDLHKLRKYLSERGDIMELSEISPIPYYNKGDGKNFHFSFIWKPNYADYNRMWQYCKQHKKRHSSVLIRSAVEDLDLLGMNQFKKNPQEKCCW